MKTLRLLAFALLLPGISFAQTRKAIAPQTIEIPCGKLRLKAYFWKPAGAGPFPAVFFNHGSGGPNAADTAGMPMTEAAERLAPLFLKHGYAFLYLFRRGQGLSADQGSFMQDVLNREGAAKGKEARLQLQFTLLTTEQLDDVMAALSFLKAAPQIDSHRIAVMGHSFGGQLTLLAAARDTSLRAAVTFAAAAGSWEGSPELRQLLLASVRNSTAPIMLIHAANDYSTAPGRELSAELDRLRKPHLLKIYPPVGQPPDGGHNAVYQPTPPWESDVFTFLDENVQH